MIGLDDLIAKQQIHTPRIVEVYSSNGHNMGDKELLYRYDISVYTDSSTVYLHTYAIVRRTPKCFVIDRYGHEHFVLMHARKRFAYPTKELALNSLRERLKWRLRHAHSAVAAAEQAIDEFTNTFGYRP